MKVKISIFSLLIIGLFVLSCKNDSGVEPTPKPKIEGTVTFSGNWPEAADDVRIVIGTDFPIKRFDDLKMSKSIGSDGDINYSIEVEKGSYKFIGVAWKPQTGVWGLASICGVYSADTDFLAPAPVTVSDDGQVVSGINMAVDRSRAKKLTAARVVGSVDLQGAWPDSYASAVVITSGKDLIAESFDLLDFNMGTALERGQTSADYTVDTPAGTNRTIGVVFLDSDGKVTQEAVYFSQNNGGLKVQDQNVTDNQTVDGPDFNIKMGSVTSGIQGTVSFTGSWPAKAEEVRLIAATIFPPAIEELIIGEEISPDASNHKYTFYLEPAAYKLIGVAWRAEGTDWDIVSICGAYFAGEDSLAPSEVVVPDENTIVKDINIVVRRSRARKATETYIQGNVTFTGTWPTGITEARVIATTKFQIFPTILPTMLDLALSDPITPGITSTQYTLKAFPGTFAAVGVIFLKADQPLSIDDILYSLDVGGLSINPFVVPENSTVAGPNFDIKF
jgi:hypothetical protein